MGLQINCYKQVSEISPAYKSNNNLRLNTLINLILLFGGNSYLSCICFLRNERGHQEKLSGAQYKKRRLEMEVQRERISGSLKKFLKPSCSSPNPPPKRTADSMVIDDQQPSTSEMLIPLHLHCLFQLLSNPVSEDTESAPLMTDIDIADPSTWPNQLSHHLIQSIVTKGAVQIMENFLVDETGRKFSSTQYLRQLPNGEKVNRDWLVYSKKINAVFCIFCKVFSTLSDKLVTGYSNWRHLSVNISGYERK